MKIASLHTDEVLAEKVGRAAELFPKRNALFINNAFYTYEELWSLVNEIYFQIPDDKIYSRIGIYCNDDVYTYAAILAVNLYGAAYVPLNRKFPDTKNVKIIAACGLELILDSRSHKKDGNKDLANERKFTGDKKNGYILFTSGSTGEPKGVSVSTENVNSFFYYFLKNYDFNENDKFLQVYELTFDVSVFSFFMPLLVGACCYVLPKEGIKPMKTMEYLQKHNITIVSMVPSTLRYVEKYLSEIKLPSLRFSFFSGDALPHDLASKWQQSLPTGVIHNFYGPTETTIVCTRYVFEENLSAKESVNNIVPLGKTFEEMEFIIVDENNELVEKGELCFTGTQVISSYLNETNEEQFFKYSNKRFYKTGDIASVNENGNLIFHGRIDSQVKVNGYRVELGEIENVISKLLNVPSVVVLSDQRLIAFVENVEMNENEIRAALEKLLPHYKVPHEFITVEKFELNINGKVDRNKLLNLQKQD